MNFNIKFEKVSPPQTGSDGIIFELRLENPYVRTATILSCELQLWLNGQKPGEASFLGPLLPEFVGGFDFKLKFDPPVLKPFRVS